MDVKLFDTEKKQKKLEKLKQFLWIQSMMGEKQEEFNLINFSKWDIKEKSTQMSAI